MTIFSRSHSWASISPPFSVTIQPQLCADLAQVPKLVTFKNSYLNIFYPELKKKFFQMILFSPTAPTRPSFGKFRRLNHKNRLENANLEFVLKIWSFPIFVQDNHSTQPNLMISFTYSFFFWRIRQFSQNFISIVFIHQCNFATVSDQIKCTLYLLSCVVIWRVWSSEIFVPFYLWSIFPALLHFIYL